jgi:serine/threonine-protein kinase
MPKTPVPPGEPGRPNESNHSDLAEEPPSPDCSSIWWGTSETRTFALNPRNGTPDGSPPVKGAMTIDLPSALQAAVQAPSDERDVALPPGGRYLIGEEIGRGGMGSVLLGWDCQLRRAVAIKVLLPEHKDNAPVVRRFLEEARITSRLQHPGVIPIHELGVSPDERPFFVMRLVKGRTLEHLLARRDDPAADLPRLLTIFLQISQAMAYAHSEGVIHRDIKPSNVMIGAFGVVKVMDWGLAKVLGEPELSDAVNSARVIAELSAKSTTLRRSDDDNLNLPATQVGTVFGTPAYLPPEQARGEIDSIDERADVFGLGCLLCEILTGKPPYTGNDQRHIYNKAVAADLADAFARLDTCQAALDLITLAKWCLSPARSDRPATASDVLEVITAYLQATQRRAEQDLVRFFDLSLDLFCIAGTNGYFHRVNENFPRLLGYTAQELVSRPFIEYVHPDDRKRTESEMVRLSSGEPCIRFVNRYRHAQGHYLWLEWNAQSVPEERAIYAVARDVTFHGDH